MITKTTISQSWYYLANASKREKTRIEKQQAKLKPKPKAKVKRISSKERRMEVLKKCNNELITRFNIRIYSTKAMELFCQFRRVKQSQTPKDPRKANNKTLLEFTDYLQNILF
jgi:hypothetical protein